MRGKREFHGWFMLFRLSVRVSNLQKNGIVQLSKNLFI